MMKKIQLLVISFLVVLTARLQAQECCERPSCFFLGNFCFDKTNLYAKFFGGVNFLQSTDISDTRAKYNAGHIIAGSLGYRFCNGLILEGEYAFRRNSLSKIEFVGQGSSHHGHFQTSSYMANLLWNLPCWNFVCWNIHSFIGAGIGYDFSEMHSSNSLVIFNQKWHQFSWQVMTGVVYPLFCNTKLTLEYKYHQGGSHFYNNSIGLGLIYTFGCNRFL